MANLPLFFCGKKRIQELEAINRDISEKAADLRIKLIAAKVKIALLKREQANAERANKK